MKKFYFIFSFLFLIPFITLATSGACSSHGGVNCSAGASFDGKVVCNDGWSNSSVYFSDANECRATSCTPPSGSGCKTESDYATKQVQLNTQGGYLGTTQSQQGVLQQCRNEITAYQSASQSYNNCLSSGSSNSSGSSYSSGNFDSYLNSEMQTYCSGLYGANAGYNSSTKHCSCNNGFLYFNNKCVPEKEARDQSCIKDFGEFSIATPNQAGKCSCLEGYEFNVSDQCVQSKVINENLEAEKNTAELLERVKKAENTPKPVKSKTTISVPKKAIENISKESEKKETEKIIENQSVVTPLPPQNQSEIKPIQKQSIFKRIGNWFINLFN